MITLDEIKKFDKKSMYSTYDSWDEIAEKFFNLETQSLSINNVDNFVFGGMGGSGTIGDIFGALFSKTNIPVTIVKGYNLPKTVTQKSLVVTTSVSGNTVETLNILKNVKDLGLNSISFSDGGKVEEYCKKNNLEFRRIEKIHSPRASLPAYLYAMLKNFEEFIPIKRNEVKESIEKLKECKKNISSENLSEDNISLNLANQISDLPIIYYPWGLQAAAIRFKNSLQENSKTHVIAEDIIEASHNGIVPWEYISKPNPILIQGEDDFVKTKERWKIIKEFFNENQIKYLEIFSGKGNIITKLMYLIYVLDFSSIYRAICLKIDPTPVNPINFIKNRL